MDIKQIYREETELDVYTVALMEQRVEHFSDDYVKWLEEKINLHKITVFTERLKKIGIEIKLGCNYPWVYIDYINGKRVTESFQGNHGFTLLFIPIKKDKEIDFTDTKEIFKLIRKYCA